jgi:hypothetical protein
MVGALGTTGHAMLLFGSRLLDEYSSPPRLHALRAMRALTESMAIAPKAGQPASPDDLAIVDYLWVELAILLREPPWHSLHRRDFELFHRLLREVEQPPLLKTAHRCRAVAALLRRVILAIGGPPTLRIDELGPACSVPPLASPGSLSSLAFVSRAFVWSVLTPAPARYVPQQAVRWTPLSRPKKRFP